jgi:hypothetical protein
VRSKAVAPVGKPGQFNIRKAVQEDGSVVLELIRALADYEKLPPPDEAAQQRLLADAFADRPRFEVFLAEVNDASASSDSIAVGYAIVF